MDNNIRKYLSYALAIFLCVVIFSSMISAAGTFLYSIDAFDYKDNTYEKSTTTIEENVKSLYVDLNVCNLTIEYAKNFEVTSNYGNNLSVYVDDNDTLNIVDKDSNKVRFFSFFNHKYEIKLTIPQMYMFDNIVINSDVAQNEICPLNANNITINNGVGQIKIDKLFAQNITINNDVGEIDASIDYSENIVLDNSIGSIKLKIKGEQRDFYIETNSSNLSSIKIDGKKIDDVYNNESAPYKMNINVDLGDIKVNFD